MKAGVGAGLAEKAATMTGSKARHQRKGLIGPPTPTPAMTGLQTRLPLGRAKAACLAKMKAMIRSANQRG
eukprot:12594382-Alexandrium_andersonii.AAC.1